MKKLAKLVTAASLLLSVNVFSANQNIFENVPVKQAQSIIEQFLGRPEFELLDVRTDAEFAQAHIKGARKIDFYSDSFKSKIDALDKDKTYVVYCRSGNRSSKTLALMKQLGFKKVYNVQGGIIDWYQQKLPLEIAQ